jgi:hypothetical protein
MIHREGHSSIKRPTERAKSWDNLVFPSGMMPYDKAPARFSVSPGERFMRATLALLATLVAAFFAAASTYAGEPNQRVPAPQKPAAWGTVLGRIVIDGEAPPLRVVPMSGPRQRMAPPPGNPAGVPLPVHLIEDSLLVGENHGLANAFVYVRSQPSIVHPAEAQAPARKHELTAGLLRFEPHALFLRCGDTLVLKNVSDQPLNVKMHGNSEFNLLVAREGTREWTLKEANSMPLPLDSNIQQWMKGYLLVRDNSYGCITNERGMFVIANLPLHEPLDLQFWHARAGYLRNVTSTADHKTSPVGQMRITLTEAVTDLGEFRVTASLFQE